jgi:hypothetical protein
MKFAEVTGWVEEHPTESIVIGAGGVIVVLWLLGFFSSSSSASDSGSSNLASAYYAAEAQQAVVGGQIQMATIQSAAATAQNAAQVNGAVAINKAQTKAATTINGQNATAATTINASNNAAALGIDAQDDALGTVASNNQLLATYSNNATTQITNAANNNAAVAINTANNNTSSYLGFLNAVIPGEFARMGQGSFAVAGPGGQEVQVGGAAPPQGSPAWYSYLGYSASDAQRLATPQGSAA